MENTEENNILVAEFMGRDFFAYNGNRSFNTAFKSYAECQEFINSNKLVDYKPELGWEENIGKYHESWNWLMPVIEKINNITLDEVGEVGMVIYPDKADVIDSNDDIMIEGLSQKTLIHAVYNTVIEFIKWHNQIINQ